MKLFRRKPEYATAMKISVGGGVEEYVVQDCDESGKPLPGKFRQMGQADFEQGYEPHRVRNRKRPATRKPRAPRANPDHIAVGSSGAPNSDLSPNDVDIS